MQNYKIARRMFKVRLVVGGILLYEGKPFTSTPSNRGSRTWKREIVAMCADQYNRQRKVVIFKDDSFDLTIVRVRQHPARASKAMRKQS